MSARTDRWGRKPVTQPGRHGTLTLYAVDVVPAYPGQPPYRVRRWGYDATHARERVVESEWFEGDTIGDAHVVRA